MKDKYTEQVKFVKALAVRLPDDVPPAYQRSDRLSKHQTLADIKRLRRELMELAYIVEQL